MCATSPNGPSGSAQGACWRCRLQPTSRRATPAGAVASVPAKAAPGRSARARARRAAPALPARRDPRPGPGHPEQDRRRRPSPSGRGPACAGGFGGARRDRPAPATARTRRRHVDVSVRPPAPRHRARVSASPSRAPSACANRPTRRPRARAGPAATPCRAACGGEAGWGRRTAPPSVANRAGRNGNGGGQPLGVEAASSAARDRLGDRVDEHANHRRRRTGRRRQLAVAISDLNPVVARGESRQIRRRPSRSSPSSHPAHRPSLAD